MRARDSWGPIVGRDREIGAIVEVLLRKTKRNPMLLGPAGSGKTAIVEGLAIRIARTIRARVPEPLRDVRLFDVALLPLAEAIAADATLLRDLLAEVRHPSVVVFFDEIHLLAAPSVTRPRSGTQAVSGPGRDRLYRRHDGRGIPGAASSPTRHSRDGSRRSRSSRWTRGRCASC